MDRALFLDRDGTLIADPGYAYRPEQFVVLPGVIEGLQRLTSIYRLFIVTNQSGIARGYYTEAQFHAYNALLVEALARAGVTIERTYFCPHLSGCPCKKPSPKFLLDAAQEYEVDLSRSWMLGDHPSDVQAGLNAGCRTIYLLTGHGRRHEDGLVTAGITPEFVARDFAEATRHVLAHQETSIPEGG